MNSHLRVLIVEDEALFRELLVTTLEGEPGLEIVGQAGDGPTAIELRRVQRPPGTQRRRCGAVALRAARRRGRPLSK